MDLATLAKLQRKLREIMLLASSRENEPVSSGQVTIFEDVYKHRPTTVHDITRRTQLAQSYVSKTIAIMKQEKIVLLRQSRTDRRKTIITFNSELHNVVHSMGKQSVHDALKQALPNQSSKDIVHTEMLLAELAEILENVEVPKVKPAAKST